MTPFFGLEGYQFDRWRLATPDFGISACSSWSTVLSVSLMTKAMVAIMFSTHPPWGPEDQQVSLVGASCLSSDLLGRRYENPLRKSTEVQTDDLSVVGGIMLRWTRP